MEPPDLPGDGGSGQSAELDNPAGVVLDPGGNIYIADSGNNRVRKVNGATGVITTIAGNMDEAFGGDGGPAPAAGLYGPYSVFVDQAGDLLISDLFHNRVREISSNVATLPEYATIRVGKVSPPQAQGYENDGNGALLFSSANFAVLNNSALDPATTTCGAGATLAIDVQCNLGVEFAPTVTGMPVYGTLTINSNAADTPSADQSERQRAECEPDLDLPDLQLEPEPGGSERDVHRYGHQLECSTDRVDYFL